MKKEMKKTLVFIAVMVICVPLIITQFSQRVRTSQIPANMDKCLEEEKPKVKGQDKLNETYRMCWMRAKREASKESSNVTSPSNP